MFKRIVRITTEAFVALFVILVSAGLYVASIRGVPGNVPLSQAVGLSHPGEPFESSHERAPYALLLSLVNDHKVDLSKDLADFGAPDVGFYNDKFFILFPPGVSFLMYPFYLLGFQYGYGQIASYASIGLFAVGAIFLMYLVGRQVLRLPVWVSVVSAFVFGFGTTSWSYAVTIYQHIPTAFFLLLAFYAAWRYRRGGELSPLWASMVWISFGLGLFIDIPNLILLLPILIYFFLGSLRVSEDKNAVRIRWRLTFVATSVWVMFLIVCNAYYNQVAFGDWKKFGQSFRRYESEEKFEERLVREAQEATMSGTLVKPKKSSLISIFKEQRLPNGLYELLVADDKGIFYFSPVLILAILGFFLVRKKFNAEYGTLLSVVLVNTFIYASFSDPYGGWAYGPRYLIPSMSLLSLMVGEFLARFRFRFIGKLLFYGLFACSSALALLAVLTSNTIPPKVEAIPIGMPYNWVLNIDYMNAGKTMNFVFTQYVSPYLTIWQYYGALYAFVMVVMFLLVFIWGSVSKQKYVD